MERVCFEVHSDGGSFVKALLLCSYFEAYSICNETHICPLRVYLLAEILCMSLKCHLDRPFLV